MEKTYLFYDIETSGLNPCFDQMVQFAAIRTDEQLNEIEHHQFFIRLNPDVIPSPSAFLTHGILLSHLKNQPCEYEIVQKIHALLNTPNTWSIGYNNLGFDDEFLRFSFYRNLLSPYTHQWANGCGRMDLYPITVLYFLYQQQSITWPMLNDIPSLKLENLNASNNWITGKAHDAMVDVQITLALAKALKKHEKIWNYANGYFHKSVDGNRINQLPDAFDSGPSVHKEALLLQGKIGSTLNYQAPVISLGTHQHYKNQTLWLRLDTDELSNTTNDCIDQTTFVFRKRLAEPPLLLSPLKRFCKKLDPERIEKSHLNKAWLKKHKNIFQLICDYHQGYKYPQIENCDIDADLYQQPFLIPEERYQCNQFHAAKLNEKPAIIKKMKSERLRKQALRLLARNYPNELSNIDTSAFLDYLNIIYSATPEKQPLDYKGERHLSFAKANEAIKTIIANKALDKKQNQILEELKQYLSQKN